MDERTNDSLGSDTQNYCTGLAVFGCGGLTTQLTTTMILLEVRVVTVTYVSRMLTYCDRRTTLSSKLLWQRKSQSEYGLKCDLPFLKLFFRPSSLDVQFVDYDGVRFHLSTPERKTALLLSMHIRCWAELVQHGANDVLKREYGSLMKGQAEPEYNVSLEIDLEQVPAEGGKCATILSVIATHSQ